MYVIKKNLLCVACRRQKQEYFEGPLLVKTVKEAEPYSLIAVKGASLTPFNTHLSILRPAILMQHLLYFSPSKST